MEIPIEKGLGYFNKKLLSYIEQHKNSQAISIIGNYRMPSLTDSTRKTLLHYAAEFNNSAFAQYLIDRGCNVDAKDMFKNTPLMIAVNGRHKQVTKTLLDANAKIGDFNVEEKHVMISPMIRKSKKDLTILKMLFDKITDGYFDDKAVAQKLFEIHCPFPAVIFLRNAELTRLMIDLGCSVDERLVGTRETALHLAIRFSDIQNLKILVDHEANFSIRDYSNRTPLFLLKMFSDTDEKLEILKFLLDKRVSLTEEMHGRYTIISKLLVKGDRRTVEVLLPYIDLFETDYRQKTPVHYLAENQNSGIVDLLRGQQFDINARDSDGWSLVDTAADCNNVHIVQFLLESGANANNKDEIGHNTSLNYLALDQEMFEPDKTKRIIELLLQYGADAQHLDENNFPLIDASKEERFFLLRPVLAHLAMLESFGKSLNSIVYEEIKSSYTFNNYFISCKLELEQMKTTMMNESVRLHMLLAVCQQKIALYSLSDEFVANYELFVKNNRLDLDSYYISTLELRVDETMNMVRLKKKAAGIVCEIIGLPCTMFWTIGYNVVKYLHREDLESVLQC